MINRDTPGLTSIDDPNQGPFGSERANMSLTIAVADDHELIRKSIAALLSHHSEFQVFDCANCRQLLKLVKEGGVDVILLDVSLGGIDSIEITKRVRAISPPTRVIVLSAYLDEHFVHGLLDAGIGGYVLKSDPASQLLEAIRGSKDNDAHLSPEVTAHVNRAQASKDEACGFSGARKLLSPRQREVLRMIAEGYSTKEIAAALRIEESTVKSHRKNLMERLNIHDRVALTRAAIRMGLTLNKSGSSFKDPSRNGG